MNQLLHLSIVVLFLYISPSLHTQVDSLWQAKPNTSISAFIDVFYVQDFNQPPGTQRQPFLFNHNRHNEFNLNLGLVQFKLDHPKYRANFGLQAGTYANDNYAAEPGLLKNIFEANVGISLNKNNKLWLDAGVLPSYIGYESAISTDNFTLTRSILAASSPFFITGAKLTFRPNDRWEIAGILTNGWQRIQRVPGNSRLSFGTQVYFTPSEKTTLNWSTFIGTDDPDATRRIRYFNNFFGTFQLSDQFTFFAGFDHGIQQTSKSSSDYDSWMSPLLIGQYAINNSWKVAFRFESFQDETGIIIPTGTPNGFKVTGYSLNFDYSPADNIACRFEGRLLNSEDEIFETDTGLSSNNFIIATSLAIKFNYDE